jgi:hypothetical protein
MIDIIRFAYKGESIIEFNWQGNRVPSEWEEDGKQWYGFKVKPSKIEGPEDLKEFYKQVKRLLPMGDYSWTDTSPADLIAKLDRCRIPRVVNDRRLHDFVTVDEVPDPKLDRWLATDASGSAIISTLAEDEYTARQQLIVEFAERVAGVNGGYHVGQDKMIDWMERDRPVRNTNAGHWPESAPDIKPIEELIALD